MIIPPRVNSRKGGSELWFAVCRSESRYSECPRQYAFRSELRNNGGAATAVLAYYGTHNASGPGKSAALLTIILYCLGVFTSIFAGLYARRTTQEWSSFWKLKSYPDVAERAKVMEAHRQRAIRSKRWSTGLLVFSEIFFLAASLCLAMSLG
jgi:hypothetical protein